MDLLFSMPERGSWRGAHCLLTRRKRGRPLRQRTIPARSVRGDSLRHTPLSSMSGAGMGLEAKQRPRPRSKRCERSWSQMQIKARS